MEGTWQIMRTESSIGLLVPSYIAEAGKQKHDISHTGDYIQYPVINHNGKEYKKECVCVCVCI